MLLRAMQGAELMWCPALASQAGSRKGKEVHHSFTASGFNEELCLLITLYSFSESYMATKHPDTFHLCGTATPDFVGYFATICHISGQARIQLSYYSASKVLVFVDIKITKLSSSSR